MTTNEPFKWPAVQIAGIPVTYLGVRWTMGRPDPADEPEFSATVYWNDKPTTTLVIRPRPTGEYGIHVDDDPDILGEPCLTLEEAVRRADSYISGYMAALEIAG